MTRRGMAEALVVIVVLLVCVVAIVAWEFTSSWPAGFHLSDLMELWRTGETEFEHSRSR